MPANMPDSNDPLMDAPKIIAQRDDDIVHRRQRSDGAPVRRAATGSKEKAAPTAVGGAGVGLKIIAGLAFLLAIGAGAAAGFLYQEGQKLQRALEQSNMRIADLEGRLSSTDDSMSQSTEAMAVKIKELYSEVDKLWASAWRKNKGRLDDLDAAAKKSDESLAGLNKKLTAVGGDVSTMKKQADALKQQIAAAQELSITLATLKEQLNSQGNTIGKVNSMVTTMTSDQKALDARVRQTEDWVQSNIEFRKQVNSRLTALEGAPSIYEGAPP